MTLHFKHFLEVFPRRPIARAWSRHWHRSNRTFEPNPKSAYAAHAMRRGNLPFLQSMSLVLPGDLQLPCYRSWSVVGTQILKGIPAIFHRNVGELPIEIMAADSKCIGASSNKCCWNENFYPKIFPRPGKTNSAKSLRSAKRKDKKKVVKTTCLEWLCSTEPANVNSSLIVFRCQQPQGWICNCDIHHCYRHNICMGEPL